MGKRKIKKQSKAELLLQDAREIKRVKRTAEWLAAIPSFGKVKGDV